MTRSAWLRHGWLPLCVAAGLISVSLGQDATWDLQNYHFYNAFALLHPARWRDVDIAQIQSFLNPVLDIPLYLLTVVFARAPRAVAFCMGLPYGLLAWFTARIAWRLLGGGKAGGWAAGIAVVLGVTGSATFSQIGLATNEISTAALVIAGLDMLLSGIAAPCAGLRPFLLAGLLTGLATGAKLTAVPYAIGLAAAALAALPRRRRLTVIPVLGLAGAAGVLVTGGFWMLHLYRLYGNPIFPFDNQIFNSPWAGPWSYADTRFLPRSTLQEWFYPFFWARMNAMLVTESPFADPRCAAVFLTAPIAAFAALRHRRLAAFVPAPEWRALMVFWVTGYILWEKLFSIYRYAIPLELAGGILIVGGLRALLPVRFVPAAAVLTAIICLTTHDPGWGRMAFQPRAVPVSLPPISPGTLVVSSGTDAVSFVAALAPADTVFVGGNGNFQVPDDSLTWRRVTGTIAHWQGPIAILEPAAGDPAGRAALAANFGIAADGQCQAILDGWPAAGPRICQAHRIVIAPDQQPTLNLAFSDGANGLADAGPGWAPPEDWGMWSTAPDASLTLPVNPLNRRSLLLTILCFSIPSAASPGRHVDVYADGRLIAHWSLNKYPETFAATIPAAPGAGTLALRFHTLDPISPSGTSEGRQLGMALQHLTIQQGP